MPYLLDTLMGSINAELIQLQHKDKTMTKGEIRAEAISELKRRGFDCWVQNNFSTRGRKFIGRLGVSDIIGYSLNSGAASMLACEVKTVNDYLTPEQKEFLKQLQKAGGFSLIATEDDFGKLLLNEYICQEL